MCCTILCRTEQTLNRSLREQQDAAYRESERLDREKEQRKQAEMQKQMEEEREREQLEREERERAEVCMPASTLLL